MAPSVGSYKRVNNLIKVVFPAPLSPTMDNFSPGRIVTLTLFSTLTSLFGYLNDTFLNSSVRLSIGTSVSFPLKTLGFNASNSIYDSMYRHI